MCPEEKTGSRVEELIGTISNSTYSEWYRDRVFARNIREGKPYFNGPNDTPPPGRHNPSSLLQCQRKTYYKQHNAPEETIDAKGILWFGSRFEEDIVLLYLDEKVAGSNEYVTNSLWVDYAVETDCGDIQIKGTTDPAIVTPDYEIILLTEIKTKKSIDHLDRANQQHRAQLHAYMEGLTRKTDRQVTDAVILYGSRTTFQIQSFHVSFDPDFWQDTVLQWAEKYTSHRLNSQLPPAKPEQEWECRFCDYRERCGKGDCGFKDEEPEGLLPRYTDYPREKIHRYLKSNEEAKLTPSLAHQFPDLAAEFGAFDWRCEVCGVNIPWKRIPWNGDVEQPPECPSCTNVPPGTLVGPMPADQCSTHDK